MGAIRATDDIWYVGVLDKNLRVFDIVMYTEHGTTYNSYLIRGKEKTVLFETVKDRFHDEFLANLKEVCDPAEIDYIVVSHTEPDHTGSLKQILTEAPNATVLASSTAITFLQEIVNGPFPHRAVTDKDVVDLGGMTLHFMSLPMLHWPDTMFTYIPEIKALFTCDSFGCHYADDRIFNDLMADDGDFTDAYKYYFDNIMGPYKDPFMKRALDKMQGLDIDFIGNGHGPVLRADTARYIQMYRDWCAPEVRKEKRVAIPYVSAYGYTRAMAEAIEAGLRKGGIHNVTLYDLVNTPMEVAKAAVAEADGVLLGSPTLVGDALPPLYEVVIGLNPVIHKGKFAGAFGSFGWSGEAVHNLTTRLELLRFTLPLPGLRVRLKPTGEDLEAATKFGEDFAEAMLAG